MNWLDKHWRIVELIGIVAGIVVWAYSTFATASSLSEIKSDLSDRQGRQKLYIDERNNQLRDDLKDMRVVIDKIDQRTFEMAREKSR